MATGRLTSALHGCSGVRVRERSNPGFQDAFYDAYHEVHPRSEPFYAERQRLYELYHHLNVRGEIETPDNSIHSCSGEDTGLAR